jgi:hypothetical protein
MSSRLIIFPLSCALLAVAAFLAFTSGGSASNIAPQPAVPVAVAQAGTVTEHLMLNANDFMAHSPNCPIKTGDEALGLIGTSVSANGCQDYKADIHIPDGSVIKSYRATYNENEPFENMFVGIHVTGLAGGAGIDSSLSSQLPTANGTITTSTITNPDQIPVDNINEHYTVDVVLDQDSMRLYSIVFEYERPADSGGSSAFANGDVDCNGTVDTMDDLALLKHQAGFADNPACPIG